MRPAAPTRLELAAAAFDRLSTVVIGGAILAPLFQDQEVNIKRLVVWAAAAFLLHGAAQSMPTTVDPTWSVPVACLIIAASGVAWAKLYARAHERRYGPDPGTVTPRQAGPSSRR